MTKKKKATIILPIYNEEQAIDQVMKDLTSLYSDYEIIAINDGSTDHTEDILKKFPCTLISHSYNRGYGASWKTGIKYATNEIIIFYDGDGQFDPLDIQRILDKFNSSNADLVIGKRKKDSYKSFRRRPGKAILAGFANLLVGKKIPDLNCGLRGFKKEVVKQYTHLFPDGFSASTTSTIVFIKRGYKIDHVPLRVKKRIGKSTVKPIKDGLSVIVTMIRLIALFDPLRIFLNVAAILFVIAVLYSLFEIIRLNQGVPVLGAIFLLSSVLFFALGIISDQVSQLRLERYEKD